MRLIMDLEQKSILRLQEAAIMSEQYYGKPFIITTSGGKDSDVCLELARRSGIVYEVQHHLTTADAPQTIYHVVEKFKQLELHGIKCTITRPLYKGKRSSMWKLIVEKGMLPTRIARYCCAILKESSCENRVITTGVRWAESTKRKQRGVSESINKNSSERIILMNDNDDKRQLIERCQLKSEIVYNPIIDWSNSDIWGFIHTEKIKTNPLYQHGFSRVGCIGCPMAGKKRYFEFRMFPEYEKMYRRATQRLVQARETAGKNNNEGPWRSAESMWNWWMEEDSQQTVLLEFQSQFIWEEKQK